MVATLKVYKRRLNALTLDTSRYLFSLSNPECKRKRRYRFIFVSSSHLISVYLFSAIKKNSSTPQLFGDYFVILFVFSCRRVDL